MTWLSEKAKAFVQKMLVKGYDKERVAVMVASEVFNEIDKCKNTAQSGESESGE